MVGVANLVRTIDGMPTMKVSMMPPTPTTSVIHPTRSEVPGSGANMNQLPMMTSTMPTPVQRRGMPTCTSMANASIASTTTATAQPRAGSSARP